jgi:dephospho-CoA kinase
MGQERRSQERRDVVAVGLTGGIGAGKSTALALFRELGALTVSADRVVRGLYARREIATLVAEHFGPEVLSARGRVDRARLAEAVRGRPEELAWLERLTHPRVAEEIEQRIAKAPPGTVVVCEVPLLFEADYEARFDLVVTIEAGPENRRRRSTHDFGLDQFAELESLQASTERRVAGSDLAFFNDGGRDELRAFVRTVYEQAQDLLRERG